MNKLSKFLGAGLLSFMVVPSFATDINTVNKVSYILGYQMGNGFSSQNIAVNQKLFETGFDEGLTGKKSKYTDEEMKAALEDFQKELIAKYQKEQDKVASTNLKASMEYLKKVSTEKGIVKLTTGIYYKVDTKGNGAKPTLEDTVTVNYEGKLVDGSIFDSSYKRNEPISFALTQVIPCWTSALQNMEVGSTWTIYCSPEQAYGNQGAPAIIGPNQALTFKVELLAIKKGETVKKDTKS